QATGKILNDDLSVSIEALEATVTEGDADTTTIAKYRISIPTVSAHDVSVTVEFDDEASTATLGSDFTLPGSMTVTIPAGQTFVDFEVTNKGDSAFEANESIILNLVNPVNVAIGTGTATTLIGNDDDVP